VDCSATGALGLELALLTVPGGKWTASGLYIFADGFLLSATSTLRSLVSLASRSRRTDLERGIGVARSLARCGDLDPRRLVLAGELKRESPPILSSRAYALGCSRLSGGAASLVVLPWRSRFMSPVACLERAR